MMIKIYVQARSAPSHTLVPRTCLLLYCNLRTGISPRQGDHPNGTEQVVLTDVPSDAPAADEAAAATHAVGDGSGEEEHEKPTPQARRGHACRAVDEKAFPGPPPLATRETFEQAPSLAWALACSPAHPRRESSAKALLCFCQLLLRSKVVLPCFLRGF